jgi:hypothetical protein
LSVHDLDIRTADADGDGFDEDGEANGPTNVVTFFMTGSIGAALAPFGRT